MDSILIDKLFTDYYSLFIFANYIGILLPCIIIAFPKFRTIPNITIAAVIAVTGSLGEPLYNCYPDA